MSRQAKILVADDEEMTRELFKKVLERAGYQVILAVDGAAAVELSASEHPDLVITDGLLPKLHGFFVCRAVKSMIPAPKVIVVSGIYTKPTYRWEAKLEYRADDLLVKPVTPRDLLACVERHLAASETAVRSGPGVENPDDTRSSQAEPAERTTRRGPGTMSFSLV